jgi:hypothetical protein
LHHFTSIEAAAKIAKEGIAAGKGIFGAGVYGSSVESSAAATLMGARSVEASIAFSTQGLTVTRTLIPGAFRVKGSVPLINIVK